MSETVVFDVDGTLSFDGRSIAAPIVDALRELRRSRQLVFASARPVRDLLPVVPNEFHDAILIGGNGAFTVRDKNTEVVSFSEAQRAGIDALIERYDLPYLIDGAWDYAFTGPEAHPIFRQLDAGQLARCVPPQELAAYSKVVLFTEIEEISVEAAAMGLAVNVHADEGTIDLAPANITKLRALEKLGIAASGYIGFGNDANDVQMLRGASVSYCVGTHPLLEFADHRIAPSSVASAISGLLLPEHIESLETFSVGL